jgi:polyhydroxybutyrate depolymerase
MRHTGRLLVRVLLLATVAGLTPLAVPDAFAAACTGVRPQAGPVFVPVGENMRAFTVRLPAKYDGKTPAPVVFAFHPGGMNMGYMQAEVPIPREWPEAIAIYPQGLPGGQGRAGWQGRPGQEGDRDLLFFDAMMAWLGEHACFDEQRVIVWGYSAGGRAANLIACQRADKIAALVIASSSMECMPTAAKPVILNHGTGDSSITYPRAVEAAKIWSKLNGCSAPPKDMVVGCFSGESCSSAPLTLCTFDGGHGYDTPFNKTAVEFLKKLTVDSRQ